MVNSKQIHVKAPNTMGLKYFTFTRKLTRKLFPMCAFAKHQIEQAKERLRNKLSYEYIVSLPKYKKITREQYEKLISNIEVLSLILIESFIKKTNALKL